jgi:hypothetical protein
LTSERDHPGSFRQNEERERFFGVPLVLGHASSRTGASEQQATVSVE